jgi:peptidyl-prolyl cis-trans isomerase C
MSARIITIAALLAALAAPVAVAEEFNPVLGKVGDFSISEIDLERIIASLPPEAQQQLAAKPELKVAMVQELLLKKATARQARKEGFDKKPEFREQLSYLIDDFLSMDYVAKVVIAGVTVPEEDLQKYYKEHEKDFLVSETARLRHIFIKAGAAAPEDEKQKAHAKAEALLQRLQKGEDFAKVAAEASEDSDNAAKGGDLGVISPGKTNSAEFEKAAFTLKTGETSGIITTPYGYHIVKVDEKSPSRVATFAETKGYITAILKKELEQKKVQEFMDKVAKESGLEVFTDRIAGAVKEGAREKPDK